MPAAQAIGDDPADHHADETAERERPADRPAGLLDRDAEVAHRERCRPQADPVGDKGVEAVGDHDRNERRVGDDERVGRQIAALERGRPGKDGISAEPDRGPLRPRFAIRQQDRNHPRHDAEREQIDRQRLRAAARRADQREGRDDRDEIGEQRLERCGVAFGLGQALHRAALGFAQGRDEDGDEQAGEANRDERRLPAVQPERAALRVSLVPAVDDHPGDAERHAAADVKA